MTTVYAESLISSAVLGVALCFGILYFASAVSKKATVTGSTGNSTPSLHQKSAQMNVSSQGTASVGSKKLSGIFGISNEELAKTLKEEFTVRKSKKVQKVLGMSEHDVREAVRGFEWEKCAVEAYIIQKTRKLQKVLGMDQNDIRDAVRNRPEALSSSHNESTSNNNYTSYRDRTKEQYEIDEPVNWFKILDGFVIIILLAICCYFFNHSTNGDFGRILVGLFPKEFKALGLKEYFEKLSPNDPRSADTGLGIK